MANDQALAILNAKGVPPTPANMQAVLDAIARDPSVADMILGGGVRNSDDSQFVNTKLDAMLNKGSPAVVSPSSGAAPLEPPVPASPPQTRAPTAGPQVAKQAGVDNTQSGSIVPRMPKGRDTRMGMVDNTGVGSRTRVAATPRPNDSGRDAGALSQFDPATSMNMGQDADPLMGLLAAIGLGGGAVAAGRSRGNPGDNVNGAGIRDGQFIGADPPPPALAAPQRALPAPTVVDNTATGAPSAISSQLDRMLALPNPGDVPTYPSGAPKIPPQPRPGSDAERRAKAARNAGRGVGGSR